MINILLVDDSEIITGGLKIILELEPEFQVVNCLQNGSAAISYCQEQPVDIVLMDVRMPVMSGLEATKAIVETTSAKVIILTTFDEDSYVVEGIKNGASGYLLKNTEPAHLLTGIKSVMNGQSVLSEDVLFKAKKSLGQKIESADLSGLTEREMQITELVARGFSNKEIAQQLFLSEGTVHNNLSTILHKLGLNHRTQLAIYYLTGKVGE